MQTEEKIKMVTAIVVMITIGIGIINIALKSYKPEDLSNQVPIRTFTFNLCEESPYLTDYFSKNPIIIYTDPQKSGRTGYINACDNLEVEVYSEEMYEGENWLLMKVNGVQGWQTQMVME